MLGGRTDKEAREQEGTCRAFKDVQKNVFSYGDSQFLNDALYENYLDMFRYYDDDFEQAACFADCMSLDAMNEDYIGRTQDYSMRAFSYLPSASFKVRSTRTHDFKKKFEYPKVHR